MSNIIFAKYPKCGKEAQSKDEIKKSFGWRK